MRFKESEEQGINVSLPVKPLACLTSLFRDIVQPARRLPRWTLAMKYILHHLQETRTLVSQLIITTSFMHLTDYVFDLSPVPVNRSNSAIDVDVDSGKSPS
jgi:hypothetical protein